VGVAALVLGIIGVLFSLFPGVGYFIGIPLSLIALILGVLGRKKAAAAQQPTGAATGGMVTGIIGLVFGILMFVVCALCVSAANKGLKEAAEKMNDPAFQKQMQEGLQKSLDEAAKKAEQPK
jgi:hypothetical protein